MRWSIDDADLIRLAKNDDEDSDGYTAKSASITVNLNAGFFNEIIREQERKQQEENYRYRIPNTIYEMCIRDSHSALRDYVWNVRRRCAGNHS